MSENKKDTEKKPESGESQEHGKKPRDPWTDLKKSADGKGIEKRVKKG